MLLTTLHKRVEAFLNRVIFRAQTLALKALHRFALETVIAEPQQFSESDFAVLRLRRWHEAFECDEPDHPLRGSLLLPMTGRGQLVSFIACGPKRDALSMK